VSSNCSKGIDGAEAGEGGGALRYVELSNGQREGEAGSDAGDVLCIYAKPSKGKLLHRLPLQPPPHCGGEGVQVALLAPIDMNGRFAFTLQAPSSSSPAAAPPPAMYIPSVSGAPPRAPPAGPPVHTFIAQGAREAAEWVAALAAGAGAEAVRGAERDGKGGEKEGGGKLGGKLGGGIEASGSLVGPWREQEVAALGRAAGEGALGALAGEAAVTGLQECFQTQQGCLEDWVQALASVSLSAIHPPFR